MPTKNTPPLALTCGDPASIGSELTLKAWRARYQKGIAPFIYIGDANHLQNTAEILQLNVPIRRINKPEQAVEIFDEYLPVLHQELAEQPVFGAPTSNNAKSVIKSIETAVEWVQTGKCRALTTNAIAKNILYQVGFKYPGHTEFLEHLANRTSGETHKSVMMLVSNLLRVVPVTIHIPLMEVGAKLTADLIYDTAKIVVRDLQLYYGIMKPKLAIAGLNPHAGEDGAMGTEDKDIVALAVERLEADGYDVAGPMPADTMFHKTARTQYDVALGMYHDQVLIPIKTLDFDNGVNVTLGLPFIRTSPDHGTAFDIAGQGIASPNSLIAALKIAHKMANNKMSARSYG
ncbi:MAG: 4-hydroxythreonine-4-phosphate dehydrogenase PdxA [Rhizobiales bacterium]|nr:4-hydroxythreonine-4-phosphate dehydrogenase PdxA [Hyphomicrobiales bacterium]